MELPLNVNWFPSGSNSFRHLRKAYSDRLVDNFENLLRNSNYVIAIHRENLIAHLKTKTSAFELFFLIFISLIKYWNCNSLFIQPHRVRKYRLVQRSRFKTRFHAVEFYFYHVTQSNDKKCLFPKKLSRSLKNWLTVIDPMSFSSLTIHNC